MIWLFSLEFKFLFTDKEAMVGSPIARCKIVALETFSAWSLFYLFSYSGNILLLYIYSWSDLWINVWSEMKKKCSGVVTFLRCKKIWLRELRVSQKLTRLPKHPCSNWVLWSRWPRLDNGQKVKISEIYVLTEFWLCYRIKYHYN